MMSALRWLNNDAHRLSGSERFFLMVLLSNWPFATQVRGRKQALLNRQAENCFLFEK